MFVTEAVAAASPQGCEVERDRSLLAVARARWRNKRGLAARYSPETKNPAGGQRTLRISVHSPCFLR
jgi:hypothetical protein